jgi:hypothetical protein
VTTRASWTLYPGRSRLPDAASPDVRCRSYSISAEVLLQRATDDGVLISHGDRHAGYAMRLAGGLLVHHYVHAGTHSVVSSTRSVPLSRWVRLQVDVRRSGQRGVVRLAMDGHEAGRGVIPALARARTGYTGVDVGCDRGLTVGGYPGPARFSGILRRIEIEAADDQWLDAAAVLEIESSTG